MSFTIKPQPAVPNTQPDAPRAVGAGLQGGSQGVRLSTPRVGETGGIDLASFSQFGSKLLEPIIKRQQDQKFIEGALRAAGGESAAEVAADRPAWATAFGDDAATQGARKYEALADAAAFEGWLTEQLPATGDMNDSEFASFVLRGLKSRSSGDPERDQLLAASVVNYLPTAGRLRAKIKIARQQERAEAASAQLVSEKITSAVAVAEKARQDPKLRDDESYTRAGDDLVGLLAVPEGVEPQSHMRRYVDSIVASLNKGQFGALQMLRERNVFDKLPAEHQDRLIQEEWRQGAKFLPDLVRQRIPEVADALLQIRMNDSLDADGIRAAAQAINAQAQMATGIVVPLISEEQQDRMILANVRDQRQQEAAAARLAESEARRARERASDDAKAERRHQEVLRAGQQKEAANRALVAGLLADGRENVAVSLATISPDAHRAGEEHMLAEFARTSQKDRAGREVPETVDQTAERRASLLARWVGSTGKPPALLAASLKSALYSNNLDDATVRNLATIARLKGSPAYGLLFTGQETRIADIVVSQLRANDADTNRKVDLKTVMQVARAEARLADSSASPSAADIKEFGALYEGIGAAAATPVLARASREHPHLSGIKDREAAMKGAAARMGVRALPGITYIQDPEQPEWMTGFQQGGHRLPDDRAGKALTAAVKKHIEAAKLDEDNVRVLRMPGDSVMFAIVAPNYYGLIDRAAIDEELGFKPQPPEQRARRWGPLQ